jgi:hypothetical protein
MPAGWSHPRPPGGHAVRFRPVLIRVGDRPGGALTTGSNGVITVTLNDIGPTTPVSYTAADAMQFAQGGPGC